MSSLVSIRRYAAKLGGRYTQVTANSGSHTTTTVLVSALVSSIAQEDLYTDYWLYMPAASAADKLRVVKTYTPASTGTLTIDRALSATTVPNSKVVELHGLCAPISDDITQYSWTDAINDALRRIYVPYEFTITPTANAVRHSLATQTWITSGDQILDLGFLTTGETRANVNPYRNRAIYGEIEQDGALLYINHEPRTFNATRDTLYVRAARRAYDLCRASGGTYGDQSGLSLETDEAPVPEEVVAYGALVAVAQNLRNDLAEVGRDHIRDRQEDWARHWTKVQRRMLQQLPTRRLRRLLEFHASRVG